MSIPSEDDRRWHPRHLRRRPGCCTTLDPRAHCARSIRDEVRHPGLKEAFKTEGDRSAMANTNAVPTMVMSNCRARNCMLCSVMFHLATVVAGICDPLDALALLASSGAIVSLSDPGGRSWWTPSPYGPAV